MRIPDQNKTSQKGELGRKDATLISCCGIHSKSWIPKMPHLHQILLIIHVLRTFFLKFTHFFRIFSKTEKQNPHQLLRADNKNIIRYCSKW